MSQLRRSDVRFLGKGDRHVMAHLGIDPDVGVRLSVQDSSAWYYDPSTLVLHEWLCQCRACRTSFRLDEPSARCRFKRRFIAHQSFEGMSVDAIRALKAGKPYQRGGHCR